MTLRNIPPGYPFLADKLPGNGWPAGALTEIVSDWRWYRGVAFDHAGAGSSHRSGAMAGLDSASLHSLCPRPGAIRDNVVSEPWWCRAPRCSKVCGLRSRFCVTKAPGRFCFGLIPPTNASSGVYSSRPRPGVAGEFYSPARRHHHHPPLYDCVSAHHPRLELPASGAGAQVPWRRPGHILMGRVRPNLKTNALAFPQPRVFSPRRQRGFSPPPATGKWLAIHLPRFGLEVLTEGVEVSTPFAVVEGKPKGCLLVCNERAEEKGLRIGMSASAAFALANDLHTKERDEVAERAALEALAGWATQFTSLVSLAPPQALLLEVGGSERLFAGMPSLIEAIDRGLTQLGYATRIAVAPTPLAALLLSRAGTKVTSQTDSMTRDLAGVSLENSGLDTKVVQQLRTLGLRTFADCYRLPRDGLARRVGPQVVTFLDKVLGKRPDPPASLYAPRNVSSVSCRFPMRSTRWRRCSLRCAECCWSSRGMLRAGDDGVQELEISLFYRKHPPTRVDVRLLSPSRDERHLQTLLKESLDRLSPAEPGGADRDKNRGARHACSRRARFF